MSESRTKKAETALCPRCGLRYEGAARYCQRDGSPLVSGDTETDPYLGREVLGQFRIEDVIGEGGMGRVYRAHQPSLQRDVAIKILHAELADHEDAVRRFQREARVATALDNPHVVHVLMLDQLDDGSLCLVMEYLSGKPLGELVRNEGALGLDRALHIALQICDGVGEAHEHGVVHRDVKPENVMLVRRGSDPEFVKVLDFGIARLLWGEQTVATQSGVIFGTARYISPEGASGEPTDARSDVYSIAVLLYQLLAGVTPFDGSSPVTLLLQHVNDPPPDIRERARVPGPVAEVIMRALSKDPGRRPADAQAFGRELREAAAQSRSGAIAGPPPRASGAWNVASVSPARAQGAPAVGPAAPGPDTLARAPDPFRDPTEAPSVRDSERGRARIGIVATVLLAFVLGAGAVTAGAVLVAWLTRPAAPAAGAGGPSTASGSSGDGQSAEPRSQPPSDTLATTPAAADGVDASTGAPEGARAGAASGSGQEPRAEPGPEPEPARTERRRRRAPPVTTIGSGRGTVPEDASSSPRLAPAVEEGAKPKAEPTLPPGEADAASSGVDAAAPSDPSPASPEVEPSEEGGPEPEPPDADPPDTDPPELQPPPWSGDGKLL